jgi:hypothetical protein
MLIDIKQSDKGLLPVINDYGCLFLCFAYASPLIFKGAEGRKALNKIWTEATKKGYISGDLNKDGDFDDDGEAEILNHNALANEFFAMDVKYDGVHHKADEKIPSKVKVVFGRYVWKGGHFVVLTKSKSISCDPMGKSNTVMNGRLDTMRFYY